MVLVELEAGPSISVTTMEIKPAVIAANTAAMDVMLKTAQAENISVETLEAKLAVLRHSSTSST